MNYFNDITMISTCAYRLMVALSRTFFRKEYWQQKGIRCKIFTICTVELNFSANDILLLSLFHIHIHSTGKICLKSFKISSVQKLLKEKKYTNFQIIRQKLAPGLQKNKPFMLNYLVHIYVSRLNAVFRLFPYGI